MSAVLETKRERKCRPSASNSTSRQLNPGEGRPSTALVLDGSTRREVRGRCGSPGRCPPLVPDRSDPAGPTPPSPGDATAPLAVPPIAEWGSSSHRSLGNTAESEPPPISWTPQL